MDEKTHTGKTTSKAKTHTGDPVAGGSAAQKEGGFPAAAH